MPLIWRGLVGRRHWLANTRGLLTIGAGRVWRVGRRHELRRDSLLLRHVRRILLRIIRVVWIVWVSRNAHRRGLPAQLALPWRCALLWDAIARRLRIVGVLGITRGALLLGRWWLLGNDKPTLRSRDPWRRLRRVG